VETIDASEWTALGTTARVVTAADALDVAVAAVERELHAVDLACSRFRDDSELVTLARCHDTTFVAGPTLVAALVAALRAARITDGAVDPTGGASIRSLGYDRDFASVSDDPQPFVAVAMPGWACVRVDEATRTIRLPRGVDLDLGATAKAFAADRAAAAAAAAAGAGVLVSLGGDIAVAGAAPEGGWPVRVDDDHRAALDQPGHVVSIEAGGLATSSTTVRAWQRGAERVHHIVDPATGRPAVSPWRTVSVLARTCTDANTAATATFVKGAAGEAWLSGTGLPARLVAHDGEVTTVNGWPA
jgi:thiamine biosynthesis lipoprotein